MLKTSMRRFEESLQSDDHEGMRSKLQEAVSHIDKAAAKGILHKNNAARKKSRLNRLFNKSSAV